MAGWRVADPCHLMSLGRDVPAPVHLPRVPPGSFAPPDDEAGQRVCAVMDETVLSTYSRRHTALNIHQALCSSCSRDIKRSETKTLRAGCSKAAPTIFAPPQTPFLGAQDGQNLIIWRWSLPLSKNPVW